VKNAFLNHPDGTTTLFLCYDGRVYASLIDTADLPLIAAYRWHLCRGASTSYVVTKLNPGTLYLHRLIMDPPLGLEVDHANWNGLDNRRCNLRNVTAGEQRLYHRVQPPPRATPPVVNVLDLGKWMRRCVSCKRMRARFWLGARGAATGVCHFCPQPVS